MKKSCCSANRSAVTATIINKEDQNSITFPTEQEGSSDGMVLIPKGDFLMGTEDSDSIKIDGEGPIRRIEMDSFLMDKYAVTNKEFKEFIDNTKYVTDAEKYGWSFVFYQLLPKLSHEKSTQFSAGSPWWRVVEGASWDHPEGTESSINERMDHPVIHVSWNDTMAYCKWVGKRLPTESEWEYAARGGLEQKRFPWGDELTPKGEYRCNIWQGEFSISNTVEDGYLGTAPVDAYAPNGYGLYNMSGNVWEWCQDWFSPYHVKGQNRNPAGPASGTTKSMRGGSYLCHESYCNRYRIAARTSNTMDSSSGNLGFRCVKSIEDQ
ncbi:Formylglycine-generating enzyme, required for sulfatase activity, contains SUMF1/FGE domain [Sporosarcina newyorkensis]|uniref:Formylglycine-generating enzyme, required for sulfatase activity, contains SUMF1/FGE domain n=2 Tax=Sporosarcina newyorkensis TaxID=759851 RepID=A0A1T4Y0F3_9BACL|nr:Formylglycine-generating enzyme, required for sulfatase activity, contains SUMF1/FGE domain [Sporosarcina newyorkensis]